LLDDGVLRPGEDFDERELVEIFEHADDGQAADEFGDQAELDQIFRLDLGQQLLGALFRVDRIFFFGVFAGAEAQRLLADTARDDLVESDERSTGDVLREVEPEDLLKFGLIPEFVGRLPVIATLHDLDESALVDILTKPKNALVKQYERLFEMEDVRLSFADDALKAIAKRAIARKTGARGLRSIMEAILLDTMFDLPGLDRVEEVVINGEVADSRAKPLYIYSDRREDVGSTA